MFREMRRKRQALPQKETEKILREGTSGVLALSGDDGYPYAVPLSYVFDGGSLYFHCAQTGHKLDAIRRNAKASFCVIGQDEVVSETYTTHFRSAIAFGQVRELTDAAEKLAAIRLLAQKYAPNDSSAGREAAIQAEWNALCMLELKIEHMTGKEAIELTRNRESAPEIL